MAKSKKDRLNFVEMPTYNGGNSVMKSFLSKKLTYPKDAIENKIEGTVHLKYDIDYKGKVISTHIISGIGYGCDEEASRIVKLLKFEVKKARKIKILFHKSIKIHFKLPKTPTIALNYQYQSSSKSASENKSGYNYTIKIN